jgi:hypothetical protein
VGLLGWLDDECRPVIDPYTDDEDFGHPSELHLGACGKGLHNPPPETCQQMQCLKFSTAKAVKKLPHSQKPI